MLAALKHPVLLAGPCTQDLAAAQRAAGSLRCNETLQLLTLTRNQLDAEGCKAWYGWVIVYLYGWYDWVIVVWLGYSGFYPLVNKHRP